MADNQGAINESYPLLVFRYSAKIGDTDIFFSDINGLNMQYESTEYKEATQDGIKTYQLNGQRDTPTLTLKRGMFKNQLKLYDWFNATHTSDFDKRDVVISLLDNENNAIMTWTIPNAFPTKFEGPTLDAKSNEVAFQSLEIKGSGIQIGNA